MKILIKVTKDVLKRSAMCGSLNGLLPTTNCAVALAARDLFPNARMGHSLLRLGDDYSVQVPYEVQKFILKFDSLSGEPHERMALPELSFEVEVPSAVIDKIGISEVYKVLSESKTLELVSI